MAKVKHSVQDFENAHGGGKIKALSEQVAAERAKVEALAGKRDAVHVVNQTNNNTIKFGLIGDTHYGSLYCCPENITAFYRSAYSRGFKTVLHSGDILDGWKVYRGQEFELRDVGFEAQMARFTDYAPKCKGMTTKFITGNHDQSFKTLTGIDVGGAIHERRPDWEHVGDEFGRVEFRTSDGMPYTVALWHPGGGSAYALSYRPQKHIESLEGGRKPNLAAFGHYHKSEMLPSYRNVCGMQVGCFQWQTPFMARGGMAAQVGGWLITVQPGATFNAVTAEFIAFYR